MTGAFLQPATVVQAIGRIMRPQFELYLPDGCGIVGETSTALPGKKKKKRIGHPAKWLVLLEKNNTVPAAPINHDGDFSGDNEDFSDEDDDQGEWQQMPPDNPFNDARIEDGEEEWEAIPDELVDVDPEQARALLGN